MGLPNDFSNDCKLVSECKYVIGREGGWTHISHSARKKYMAIIKKPMFMTMSMPVCVPAFMYVLMPIFVSILMAIFYAYPHVYLDVYL